MTQITERYPQLAKATERVGPHKAEHRKKHIAHWAATQNQFRVEGILAWVEFDDDGNSWCVWNSFVVKVEAKP